MATRNKWGLRISRSLAFFSASPRNDISDIFGWNGDELWKNSYRNFAPQNVIFCKDVFGQQFTFDEHGYVSIFWAETGEIEPLGHRFLTFLQLIADSPNDTISLDLYLSALEKLGRPTLNEHLAFKVENALGGAIDVDNLMIMNSVDHMRALGVIAQQIAKLPVGTPLKPRN